MFGLSGASGTHLVNMTCVSMHILCQVAIAACGVTSAPISSKLHRQCVVVSSCVLLHLLWTTTNSLRQLEEVLRMQRHLKIACVNLFSPVLTFPRYAHRDVLQAQIHCHTTRILIPVGLSSWIAPNVGNFLPPIQVARRCMP